MKILDRIASMWRKKPRPAGKGKQYCSFCKDEVHTWRTYADGEVVCVHCASRRRR
jgi:hypothetical protein